MKALLIAGLVFTFTLGWLIGLTTERIRYDTKRQAALAQLDAQLRAWQHQRMVREKAK